MSWFHPHVCGFPCQAVSNPHARGSLWPVNATPAPEVQAKISALGAQIRAERSAAGISQEALAEQLGIHANTIRNYEKGKRDIPYGVVEQIAAILGMKVSRLVGLAEERLNLPAPSA